jgi:small conductance mechanosensitive channel
VIGMGAWWGRFWLVVAILLVGLGPAAAQSARPDAAAQQKVDQLIKLLDDPDVRALLATQARQLQQPAPAMEDMSASSFTIWMNALQNHLQNLQDAVPEVPSEFAMVGQTTMTGINGRSPAGVALFFVSLVVIGLIAEKAFGRIARRIHARKVTDQTGPQVNKGFQAVGRHLFIELAPLVVFAGATVGLFLTMNWPPLLSRLIVPTLLGLIAGRIVVRLSRVLLSPRPAVTGETFIRLVPIDDYAAKFWFRRVVLFTLVFFVGWATSGIMTSLSFVPAVEELIGYAIGIVLLAVTIETIWRRPRKQEQSLHHGPKDWLMIFWCCVIWLLWVAGIIFGMWVAIYVIFLPAALKLSSLVVRTAYGPDDSPASSNSAVYEVLIERGVRAAVIGIAVLWLVTVLQAHAASMMDGIVASRIIRGVLSGVVILLGADLVWQMAKAVIAHQLERARLDQGDAADVARSGRLLTLLPILRNFLAILIAVIAIMMVLSGLGVEVGPLIAGAGIFGVAIGFGSQTLVKDVISGIFYMMDDAFRVGEYIQSGNYKGTVESFSIRSVKLRHHRGPIFTVPFGTLGAVENMSRDWVIDKFLISVSYQTDIALVKRLVKGVGAELLEDEELGPMIIETVKMKGVEQFGDYGINLSFAMTTKPGQQSTIRRRAYAMIRDAFTANGISFASPTVQVAGDERGAASAAAAANNAIALKTAAELKAAEG